MVRRDRIGVEIVAALIWSHNDWGHVEACITIQRFVIKLEWHERRRRHLKGRNINPQHVWVIGYVRQCLNVAMVRYKIPNKV